MTAERFAQHVERNAVDLTRSPRWTVDAILSGVALLGFRARRAWLGGFGVVPEFRGRGLGRRYLDDVLQICRDAGAETLELEVLVRNGPAVALYRNSGFATIDELVVWSRPPVGSLPTHSTACRCDELEIVRVMRTPAACWQRESQSIAAAAPRECIIVGNDAAPRAYAFVRRNLDRATLLDAGARDAASAARLLDALDAALPELPLMIINEPAHGPLNEAFTASASWIETTRQYQMRRSLDSVRVIQRATAAAS